MFDCIKNYVLRRKKKQTSYFTTPSSYKLYTLPGIKNPLVDYKQSKLEKRVRECK